MDKYNKRLGDYGEDCATSFLKLKGYTILERNYRAGRGGEIDIIAEDKKGVLVFLEVKTRSSTVMGDPSEAVNYYKRKNIINTALKYIHRNNLYEKDARFDVIEVLLSNKGILKIPRINHIKEAFEVN